MSNQTEVIQKALGFSEKEWNDLSGDTRNIILKSLDLTETETVPTDKGRAALVKGIKKVLSLHPDQYNALPDYQREILLTKIDELG